MSIDVTAMVEAAADALDKVLAEEIESDRFPSYDGTTDCARAALAAALPMLVEHLAEGAKGLGVISGWVRVGEHASTWLRAEGARIAAALVRP